MGWFSRAQASRDYPTAGVSVTGSADRFRRARTTGARRAAAQGQSWDDRDRAQDRKGRWYRPTR